MAQQLSNTVLINGVGQYNSANIPYTISTGTGTGTINIGSSSISAQPYYITTNSYSTIDYTKQQLYAENYRLLKCLLEKANNCDLTIEEMEKKIDEDLHEIVEGTICTCISELSYLMIKSQNSENETFEKYYETATRVLNNAKSRIIKEILGK